MADDAAPESQPEDQYADLPKVTQPVDIEKATSWQQLLDESEKFLADMNAQSDAQSDASTDTDADAQSESDADADDAVAPNSPLGVVSPDVRYG